MHCRDFTGPVGFLQDSIKKLSCPEQGLSFAVLHCQIVELWDSDLVIEKLWTVAFSLAIHEQRFVHPGYWW